MLMLFVFFIGSALIVYVSRASLLAPRSHGFYRLFAWETILALRVLPLEKSDEYARTVTARVARASENHARAARP